MVPSTSDAVFVSKNLSNVVSNGPFMCCARKPAGSWRRSAEDIRGDGYRIGAIAEAYPN
jgi:hypothetical protein